MCGKCKPVTIHTEWLIAADYDGIEQIQVVHVQRCIVVGFPRRLAKPDTKLSERADNTHRHKFTFALSISR
jgi:hypothetical protein